MAIEQVYDVKLNARLVVLTTEVPLSKKPVDAAAECSHGMVENHGLPGTRESAGS